MPTRTRAITGDGESWDDPDDAKLYDLLATIEPGQADPFLIVERLDGPSPDHYYMQVFVHDDRSYQIEYREGGPEAHFCAQVDAPLPGGGPDKVAAVLQDYARRGDAWRTDLPWEQWRTDPVSAWAKRKISTVWAKLRKSK